ncbi:uncharacterized protein LOC134817666 [Bolinopsis microptera]|uniref:uncharacterized protein LOC134817666 n=1 Tax=Bolinopsis microptera TaxID=2820187 RepID=UPI00307B08B5
MLLRPHCRITRLRKIVSLRCCSQVLASKGSPGFGLSASFTKEELKNAYIKRVKQCHPDLHPDKHEEFLNLTNCYQTLLKQVERSRDVGSRDGSCTPPDVYLWEGDNRIDANLNSDIWLQQVVIAHRKTLRLREIRLKNRRILIISTIFFIMSQITYLLEFDVLPHEEYGPHVVQRVTNIFQPY